MLNSGGQGKKLEFSCIVLAGGKGVRFGQNKLLEKISGKSLIERVIDALSPFRKEIIVVTGKDQSLKLRVRTVDDLYPGGGPTGGIYTGLQASGSFYNLVVAADMPFLNRGLLLHLVESAAGYDAVVPRIGDMIEPLHAVYTKACLPFIKSHLEQERLNIRSFFSQIQVKFIEAEEIERFDPEHLSFFNINTKEDLRKAEEILKSARANSRKAVGSHGN